MAVTPDRWRQIQSTVEAALDRPPAERDAFVDSLCGDDGELRREVTELLAADEQARGFLEPPAVREPADAGADDVPPAPWVGPYRILRKVGEGGMSSVWAAAREDEAYEKQVAVKFFRPELESPMLAQRFRVERQILASLEHPSIARLLDGGSTAGGVPYLVMDYVEGVPIDEYCDRRRLPVPARVDLFRRVCAAVQYAHANLVVHRDIKPSNILVREDGEPKLLDFGIAKLLKPGPATLRPEPTRMGAYVMTPEYASPEQARGETVTIAADVYSLGVLLYRLLTGCLPYDLGTGSLPEIVRAVCEEEPVAPSVRAAALDAKAAQARGTSPTGLRRQLAGDLDNIVRRALRKEPERRYASVEQLSEDLRRYREGSPVAARPDTLGYRTAKFVRRHRVGTALGGLALVALVAFAITLAVQSTRLRRALGQAEAVTAFLEEALGSANPYGGVGRDVTLVQVLERSVSKIDASFAGQPEIDARVRTTLGATFRDLGRYDEARPLLERALETRRRTLGPSHPAVAESLMELGELVHDRGDTAAAERLYRDALEIRRRAFGQDSRESAEALRGLGMVLRKKGDLSGAESTFRQALDIERGLEPAFEPAVARSLRMLGAVLHDEGDYAAARPLLEEALGTLRRSRPPDSPEITLALRDYATLLTDTGDSTAAEPLFREVLERQRARLGENHSVIAESLTNVAKILSEKGELREAAKLQGEALEIFRRVLGDDSPNVARAAMNLGVVQTQLGDFRGARENLEKALAVSRKAWGPRHQHTAMVLENLGYLFAVQGDYARGERHFREAWDIMRSSVGETHPESVNSLNSLAYTVWKKGDREEALALFRQALGLYGQMKAPNRFYVAVSQSDLGALLTELGRHEEARAYLVPAYRTFLETTGPKSIQARDAAQRLEALARAWRNPRFDAELTALPGR